jgi:glycosyltransferase involved in cell wall biosynthesis
VTTPEVSVVIPTFERCSSVQRALRALGRQTLPCDAFEVLVSIDGSTDGTAEMLDRQQVSFPLRTVRQPHRGRAAARNAGGRQARGRLLVFLDDDMEAAPGLLAAHVEAHGSSEESRCRAVVGAAPIVTRSGSPLTDYLARSFQERLTTLAQPGRAVRFNEAYTGNLSVPRATLLALGGFDETFRLYGHEDYEFALRLVKAGVRLEFSAAALAFQHQEKGFRDVARDAIARGRTAVLFVRKHPEALAALKLGAFDAETRKWRLLRSVLLRLTRRSDVVPDAVIRLVSTLELRRPRRLDRYYAMALDYCYWVGAQAAQRDATAGADGDRGV